MTPDNQPALPDSIETVVAEMFVYHDKYDEEQVKDWAVRIGRLIGKPSAIFRDDALDIAAEDAELGLESLRRAEDATTHGTWGVGCDAPRNGGRPYIGATIGENVVRLRMEDDFGDALRRHEFMKSLCTRLNRADGATLGEGLADLVDVALTAYGRAFYEWTRRNEDDRDEPCSRFAMHAVVDAIATPTAQRVAAGGMRGWSAGTCHRHAPTPVAESGYGNMPAGKWPLVQSRDYCGDFKQKDETGE